MKTSLGYKVPFRQCFTHRILGKWGLIHYTLYCHVWLRIFRPVLPVIGCLVAIAIAACTTVTAPDGTKTTTVDQVAVNNGLANAEQLAFTAIQFAAASKSISISNPAAKQAAFSDLSGVAAAAQASLGKTPTSANVAQGAASPVVGTAVQDKLPSTPITQGTVNSLFAAAQSIAHQAP